MRWRRRAAVAASVAARTPASTSALDLRGLLLAGVSCARGSRPVAACQSSGSSWRANRSAASSEAARPPRRMSRMVSAEIHTSAAHTLGPGSASKDAMGQLTARAIAGIRHHNGARSPCSQRLHAVTLTPAALAVSFWVTPAACLAALRRLPKAMLAAMLLGLPLVATGKRVVVLKPFKALCPRLRGFGLWRSPGSRHASRCFRAV